MEFSDDRSPKVLCGWNKVNQVSRGIDGVLRNHKEDVLHIFSKHVVIKDSNEAKVLAIQEALPIFCTSYSELGLSHSEEWFL